MRSPAFPHGLRSNSGAAILPALAVVPAVGGRAPVDDPNRAAPAPVFWSHPATREDLRELQARWDAEGSAAVARHAETVRAIRRAELVPGLLLIAAFALLLTLLAALAPIGGAA